MNKGVEKNTFTVKKSKEEMNTVQDSGYFLGDDRDVIRKGHTGGF